MISVRVVNIKIPAPNGYRGRFAKINYIGTLEVYDYEYNDHDSIPVFGELDYPVDFAISPSEVLIVEVVTQPFSGICNVMTNYAIFMDELIAERSHILSDVYTNDSRTFKMFADITFTYTPPDN